jgi:hypothetical protein
MTASLGRKVYRAVGAWLCPGVSLVRAAIILVLALQSACSGLPLREAPVTALSGSSAAPQMSCLALSGGGMRSGAVSLGAIQGLYAAKSLSKFEIVSAVSGGGYPVYGLLDRMIRDKIALRDLLRERGKYIADVERNAGFISTWDMYQQLVFQLVGLPLSWTTLISGSLQPIYISHIHQSFVGVPLPMFGEPALSRAKDIRKIQGFPVPVFGASASMGASQPRDDYPYAFGDFFELSPVTSGAPNIGYFPNFARRVTLAQSVAISAAAIDTPQSDAQLPAWAKALNVGSGSRFHAPSSAGQSVQFYLADGGFIENLGMLPLLRRGCTDILAFDSSDDVDEPFSGWLNFATRLEAEEPGWRISKLHGLRSTNGHPIPTQIQDRWNLPHHLWDAQLENGNRRVRVRLVKLGVDRKSLQDYPQYVREYIQQDWGEGGPGCTGEGMRRRCSFPLEASSRQSYRPEEFRAYRLLGRWLAELALRR